MGLPSRAVVAAQAALWRRRESYRRDRWRRYVKTRPSGDAARSRWFGLYREAQVWRIALEEQLSRLPISHVDQAGVDLIKREEGVRSAPYDDSRGFATVGVGHLIKRASIRTMTAAERERWTLSSAEVDALLRKDLVRFERVVARAFAVKGALRSTQDRFNACVSLAFNIGDDGFAHSSVAARISGGLAQQAADAFLMWDKPPELRPRRQRERAIFMRGRAS